jgi:predicted phosphoribosyltransferase
MSLLLSPGEALLRLAHPLAPRRALLALDYGTTTVGFAVARSLNSSPAALPALRQPPRPSAGEGAAC